MAIGTPVASAKFTGSSGTGTAPPAGSDRIRLMVHATGFDGTPGNVTAMTYGGVSGTDTGLGYLSVGTEQLSLSCYYFDETDIGNFSDQSFSVTGSSNNRAQTFFIDVTGVDQTSPIRNTASEQNDAAADDITIGSIVSGDMLIELLNLQPNGSAPTCTYDSGQTQIYNESESDATSLTSSNARAAYLSASSTSENLNTTLGNVNSNRIIHAAIALAPASAAGGSPNSVKVTYWDPTDPSRPGA